MSRGTQAWRVLLPAAAFCAVSCTAAEPPEILSPSGRYRIVATIDQAADRAEQHPHIFLRLLDSSGRELFVVDSRASDYQKWALGWMPDSDTVVLYSSDIGTRVYAIENGQLLGIGVTASSQARACQLYEIRYESVSGICRNAGGRP